MENRHGVQGKDAAIVQQIYEEADVKSTNNSTIGVPGVLIALTAALTAFGCGTHTDRIGDLNDNPDRYLHQSVTIAGQVTDVLGVPLGISDFAAYRVDDGTGEIWIISHNGAPGQGDKVGVKGELEPVGDLHLGPLGNPFGDIIEESQRQT